MKVLIATDAWRPQVNGVVRTLESLEKSVRALGDDVAFVTPNGFPCFELPTYPGLRVAVPNMREIRRRIEQCAPDAIHIATEGPIGVAVRRYCRMRKIPFTTSFTTRFPEYVSARIPVPTQWGYAVLRRFHAPAAATFVSTPSLMRELSGRGFKNLKMWSRGVDTELFHPSRSISLPYPRPIFVTVGRVSVEKNLEAFLSLDLPGSKVVIGHGPQEDRLKRRYPKAIFTGAMYGERLAEHVAAADVFVFPSLTDTFGIVQLEALASGTPIAAFPVTGPLDVVGDASVGALDWNLLAACERALSVSRSNCRQHALRYTWTRSAEQFLVNLHPLRSVASGASDKSAEVRRVAYMH